MSWVKRLEEDDPVPRRDRDDAAASPLFLTSGDKSTSPQARHAARRAAAGDVTVNALFKLGNRFHDAADDAVADSRINSEQGDYMDLRSTAHVWQGRAIKVRDCGLLRTIPYRCKNGHRWEVAPMGCGLRLCPHCERRASGHVRKRLAFLLAGFRNPVRMLTLTMRNRNELQVMLNDLAAAFGRFRGSAIWRRCVAGAVAVFECTASEDRGWHAHIHIAWDGKFMPWKEVLAAWTKATRGQGTRVDLRGSRWPQAAAVNYLSKYASKGVKVVDLPESMVLEFVQAWWRFRTLRTFGTMFRAKMPKESAFDGVRRCPQCGEAGEALAFVPNLRPAPPPKEAGLLAAQSHPRKRPKRARLKLRQLPEVPPALLRPAPWGPLPQ